MTHIAIITVVYQNYSILEDFLQSLKKQTSNFHLFIADSSPERKEITTEGFELTVIPIENKGYAHGVNMGIKKARGMGFDHYCVINDDVFFKDDFIETLEHTFAEHPKTIFGGKIYYAPGYEFHKDSYAKEDVGHVIWYAGGAVDWAHATTGHRGVDEVDKGQYDTIEPTEFITGCLCCFDKTVVDTIGYWDEEYFLYYEDADFCERAKRNNIPLYYIPELNIWHKNAQSTDGSGSELHQKLQKKAHLRFSNKFAPFRTKLHVLKNYYLR